jgi:PAS domain S-box-containing protein
MNKSNESERAKKELLFRRKELVQNISQMLTGGEELDLILSGERLDDFFDLSPSLMVITNPKGEIFKINKSCLTILGYTQKEISNIGLWSLVHPDDVDKTTAVIEKQLRGDKISNFINRYKNKDGTYRILEWQATTVKDGFTYGYANDITNRNIAMKELLFQNEEKEKRADELDIANKELLFEQKEKVKRAEELALAIKELLFQKEQKEKKADELIIANKEIQFQSIEKIKRTDELEIANKEIELLDEEKEQRVTKLGKANKEIELLDEEKTKRTDELAVAIKELLFQNEEKEKRADELDIANKEIQYQKEEKEKRADELIIANRELEFQSVEKVKRADELDIANKEIELLDEEKEKRITRLVKANKEIELLDEEKQKRAAELDIAKKELVFQKKEKEKRADELIIIKDDLDILREKEILAIKLSAANKELEQFSYLASHDLQEPLRTISNYIKVFEEDYSENLDETAQKYLSSVNMATTRMSQLIQSLLEYSILGRHTDLISVDCAQLVGNVISDLNQLMKTSGAVIDVGDMPTLNLYEIEMHALFQNLISNALKFQDKNRKPKIKIRAEEIDDVWNFSISDNGIGIESQYFERIFQIFQSLNTRSEYEGTGIGLAYCKKIVELHSGKIWIESNLGIGTTFYFTIHKLTL